VRRTIRRKVPYKPVMNRAVRGLQRTRTEWKAVSASVSGTLDSTGALYLLNGIARGDDIAERIGRQVTIRSLEYRIMGQCTKTTGERQVCRIMFVYDTQTNGAALTIAQVLNSVDVYSPRNLENRTRFKVLKDWTFVVQEYLSDPSIAIFKGYLKLFLPMVFNNGDAGTVADITTGSLYCIVLGKKAAGATAGATEGTVRIRYTDA